MNARLIIRQVVSVEIEGVLLQGDFKFKDEWEGMVKLECEGPHQVLIVDYPPRPSNLYDFITKLFGGNKANGEAISLLTNVVKCSPDMIPKPSKK